MAKKSCSPKKKAAPKGLAGAAIPGGGPLEVSIKRASFQLPLRDMFAAFALAGLIADTNSSGRPDDFACASYGYAEAMLKARLLK